MGKVWVLDTETKGTGAQMVPLEKVLTDPAAKPAPRRRPKPPPRPVAPPEPRRPPKFKVVDVMTRQVLADDADTRGALDALEGIGSVVDVSVYAWDDDAGDWRPLLFSEKKALWDLRDRR